MEKKFINPLSLSVKLCALIFVILSLVFPWNNITSEDYSPTADLFINILFIAYVIGVSMSFIGLLDMARINLVEEIGIIVGIVSLTIQLTLNILMTVVFPSYGIRLELGAYFGIIGILLISVEIFFLRKRFFGKIYQRMQEKKGKSKKSDKKARISLRLEPKGQKHPKKEAVPITQRPTKERKININLEIISPYSILLKILALIIFLVGLIIFYPNMLISGYTNYAEAFITMLIWVSIFGLIVSYIGLIKRRITNILEIIALLSAFFSVSLIIILEFINILLDNLSNLNFQLTYSILFLSLLLLCIDTFIFRSYYIKKMEKTKEEEEKQEKKPILERYNRIETKADFPERWALIHGKKSTEQEDFEHFQEMTIEKSSSTYHPNFLHLLIQNLVEDRGYRLEISEKPLPQTDDNAYNFYDLNGSIKGSIRVKLGGKIEFASMSILLLGIGYLLTSIILLLADFIQNGTFGSISFISAFILIPLSFIFLIYYIIQSLKRSSLREIGYTNIYVLERGSAYYGREYTGKDNNETQKMLQNPAIGFKMILSFATCVKMMDINDAKRDLDEIIEEVNNL